MSDTMSHYFGLGSYPMKGTLFGLELEMEQVEGTAEEIPHCLKIAEDASLRNSGSEFISRPVPLEQAMEFFDAVMHSPAVNWLDKDERCSERGSIHVHVNVQDMSADQVRNMLRFYCVTEPQWFATVDSHRHNNIYCVPLHATAMPRYIQQKSLSAMADNWHKYTALNAKPLRQYGTLEFRHLQATDSADKLEYWLGCISRLRQLACEASTSDITWKDVERLHEAIFHKAMTDADLTRICYQEDLVNRQAFSIASIVQRIKETKQCAALSV